MRWVTCGPLPLNLLTQVLQGHGQDMLMSCWGSLAEWLAGFYQELSGFGLIWQWRGVCICDMCDHYMYSISVMFYRFNTMEYALVTNISTKICIDYVLRSSNTEFGVISHTKLCIDYV